MPRPVHSTTGRVLTKQFKNNISTSTTVNGWSNLNTVHIIHPKSIHISNMAPRQRKLDAEIPIIIN